MSDDPLTGPPRPPSGDWLGTPFLRFERHEPFAHVVVDRPEARNAMSPAMYFGVRYAVKLADDDPDLFGVLITGTGDVFIPGGDLGTGSGDNWLDLGVPGVIPAIPVDALRQSIKPVVSADQRDLPGRRSDDRALLGRRRGQRAGHVPVPELLRGIADTYYVQLLCVPSARYGPAT